MLVSDKCLKTCAKKAHTGTGMSKPSTRPARASLPSLAMICDARIEQFRPIRKTKETKAAGITVRRKARQTKETTTPTHTSTINIITATAAPTTCKEPQKKTIGSTISKIIVTTKKEGLGLETQRVGWE